MLFAIGPSGRSGVMGDAGPPGNVGPDGVPGQKCEYNGRNTRASKRNM